MATRSPGLVTCCRRAATARLRAPNCAHVMSIYAPSRSVEKSRKRYARLSPCDCAKPSTCPTMLPSSGNLI
ncbi:Uncharacterised protein [Mycobacteroides abscessus subsp. abscessus]|nr:Uncharacterised protein [Mycobacteroides abscessus subsp. abscessus]SKU87444.1 Uncharacterised protein [Mycobacteroides abscessus subsp. abscessus]